jgi:hypothetical protein
VQGGLTGTRHARLAQARAGLVEAREVDFRRAVTRVVPIPSVIELPDAVNWPVLTQS